eukprot:595034-Rhodomonas_salina.1
MFDARCPTQRHAAPSAYMSRPKRQHAAYASRTFSASADRDPERVEQQLCGAGGHFPALRHRAPGQGRRTRSGQGQLTFGRWSSVESVKLFEGK